MKNGMSTVFNDLEIPIYIVTTIYTTLTLIGIFFNSLVVFATMRTKSLHNSCNYLIAFGAVCDVLHQMGHIPRVYYIFSGVVFTNSWHCQMLQAIPIFGLSAASFSVLSIGMDRFISAIFPQYYMQKNISMYLGAQLVPIIIYTAWQYYLMFAYTVDQQIICIPPEAFYGEAKSLWAISSCSVFFLAVVVYSAVWLELKRQKNIAQMSRIFRSLFIIMLVVVLGWFLTMGGVLIARLFFHFEGMQMFLWHEFVGLFVNSSLAANYFVYYKTSSEYRFAFRRQFRKMTAMIGYKYEESTVGPTTSIANTSNRY